MRKKDERNRFVPFDMSFVSSETGEIIHYKQVILPQRERVEIAEQEKKMVHSESKGLHFDPYKTTVSFKKGEDFRQCHIHLITRVNGERLM